ncbi:histidine ABC transporter substrate-binding protein HisJ [Mixta theicola]|uniref:Histidine ABC transporter substrate-binding protein HisJ n=1 Tax=Mixta theicola TaxID=1458355 RepID=A0A2K1QAX9_9GAMM|nr:lysine/arginine/ornithine ABC transporter substrate-binding protein [Mixta theicola]PNS12160.1 histidine ABC transporter substrate-binding protein HisJ [Mixta theicola]GLR10666.1 amino acid ABC transporter substrate-binding protein [Mixta theicola]
MKKRVLALSLLLAFAGTVGAAVPKTLRIGNDPTYPPFESKNAQGELVGFDIDLANEICKRIEARCSYVESDFDALIPSLKAKKIDFIISSLSITEKRQQEIAFSDKLYAANARLIAPKGAKLEPTPESLKGKNIGLLQGTTQETYANQYWRPKGVTITPYANQDLVYQDLNAGRIDAAFQDEVQASEGFLKQPVGKDYAFAGPAVKDDKIFGVGTGIGLRKEDSELKAAIDKAFAEIRKDGTYDKIAKKYFDFNVYGD